MRKEKQILESDSCKKPALLLGRTNDIHDIVMNLYRQMKALEASEKGGAQDPKIRAQLKTIREELNDWGEKIAPSDFKPAIVKGGNISGITSAIGLAVEGVAVLLLERIDQLKFLLHGIYEYVLLGALGVVNGLLLGSLIDWIYEVHSGVAHNDKMVDLAVKQILDVQNIHASRSTIKKARWMFMNNIRIYPSNLALSKRELWDIANDALANDEVRTHAFGNFYIRINPDGTALYRENGNPVVVKCVEGFGVCDVKGNFIGFANYSSNNMSLTSLIKRLEEVKGRMMGEPPAD